MFLRELLQLCSPSPAEGESRAVTYPLGMGMLAIGILLSKEGFQGTRFSILLQHIAKHCPGEMCVENLWSNLWVKVSLVQMCAILGWSRCLVSTAWWTFGVTCDLNACHEFIMGAKLLPRLWNLILVTMDDLRIATWLFSDRPHRQIGILDWTRPSGTFAVRALCIDSELLWDMLCTRRVAISFHVGDSSSREVARFKSHSRNRLQGTSWTRPAMV